MAREEPKQSPQDSKQPNPVENGQNMECLFTPRFKSVAAMAGWDEEALIIASLVVEDTPDREFKHKKRSDLHFKTPPSTNSRRKRRAQRKTPVSIPIVHLNLDDEQTAKDEIEKKKIERKPVVNEEKKTGGVELTTAQKSGVSCSNSSLPCMDELRAELSCAICLEICFEPSTTTCGHSFCKKCLRSAADKCGKRCPKCRQLISNGRSCTVNTVLWNTIQLLFPQEVKARNAAAALNSEEAESQSLDRGTHNNVRNRNIRPSVVSSRDASGRRRGTPIQDEDAASAPRLERENLVRLARRDASVRRRGVLRQDEDAESALRLERENLARLASRDAGTRRRRGVPSQDEDAAAGTRRRRGVPSQDEDAALALRLQREEFMEAFRGEQSRSSLSLARANLRAMASRAINIRTRGRPI